MRMLSLGLLAVSICMGQDSAKEVVRFEVASIKPTTGREIGGAYTYPGGRVGLRGCTLTYLVMLAFDLQGFQIAGQQEWMGSERFDIDATVPAGSKSSGSNPDVAKTPMNEEQRRMLQTLLEERFGLRYRRETVEGSVYVLTRNGKPLKMTEAKNKTGFQWSGSIRGGAFDGDGMKGTNESMPDLAQRLSGYMGRPVLDRTELPGVFDFETRYSGADGERVDVVSMILTSLNEIGLKLEPSKGPVEKVVIEQAQRPTEN